MGGSGKGVRRLLLFGGETSSEAKRDVILAESKWRVRKEGFYLTLSIKK